MSVGNTSRTTERSSAFLAGLVLDRYNSLSTAQQLEARGELMQVGIDINRPQNVCLLPPSDLLSGLGYLSGAFLHELLRSHTIDIDFAAETTKDVTFNIGENAATIARGRLYVDVDPGAFAQDAILSFYTKDSFLGEDLLFRATTRTAVTQTTSIITATDTSVDVDDTSEFNADDLVFITDAAAPEFKRISSIADPTVNIEGQFDAGHASGVGFSRVVEFGGLGIFNEDEAKDLYFRVSLGSPQTVSFKMDLLVLG